MNPEKQIQIKQKCPNLLAKPLAKLKKNKVLLQSILLIIKNRIAGIISHSYENNKIMHIAYQKVQSKPQCEDKKDVLQIWMDVQLFFWNLNVSPKYWVMMLESEQFYSEQKQILDMHLFTVKIYEKVLKQAKALTPYAELINNLISGEIFMFLEQISIQICECYKRGRQIVLFQTKKIEQLIKGSSIINFYFLYKLLLEITNICSEKIMENLVTGIFSTTEINYCQSFINFIFQKYEIVSLLYDVQSHKKQIDGPLLYLLQRINNNNFKWRQAIRQDGQTAIIIEFENQIDKGEKAENFMIKMDKLGRIIVFNCNILRMKWMATQSNQKNSQILKVVSDKERLKNKLKNTLFQIKKIILTQYVISGNALGKCLADIKKYDSVGEFTFQISKKSLVNGSFNYIVNNIPLVGTLVITGGYTITLYNIFSNKLVNKKKKFQQAGFRTFDIASLLGSGLLGFVVGQSLIPIPFVGAIVGGFIGGFIGDKGGKAITSKLQSLRFKQIVEKLELQIQPEGCWQVTTSILQILCLNSQQFYNSIPKQIDQKIGSDKIWFAMIGFTIFCFNQSKKRLKFMKQKMEILQEHPKKNEQQQIDFEVLYQDTHYEASTNLIWITKYFQKNKVDLIYCFKELEKFVNTILSIIE